MISIEVNGKDFVEEKKKEYKNSSVSISELCHNKTCRWAYLYSEIKGTDQLDGYRIADLHLCFRLYKKQVFLRCSSSHAVFWCFQAGQTQTSLLV